LGAPTRAAVVHWPHLQAIERKKAMPAFKNHGLGIVGWKSCATTLVLPSFPQPIIIPILILTIIIITIIIVK
jgi:hypothetical protein